MSTKEVWMVLWAFSLIVFLTVPIVTNERRRELWIKRLRQCRWRVQITNDNNNEEEGDEEDNYNSIYCRHVLSRAREHEILQAFLRAKLTKYSKSLSASDIIVTNKFPATSTSPTTGGNNNDSTDKSLDGSGENPNHVDKDKDTADEEQNVRDKGKRGALDDESHDDSSSSEEEEHDEEFGDQSRNEFISDHSTHVQIPNLERLLGSPEGSKCEIPNGCAICLSGFEAGETVCWSANIQCKHVFHHECILDWFVASGRKQMRRRRRGDIPTPPNTADDCVALVTDFPMQCPCCRQDFIYKDDDEE